MILILGGGLAGLSTAYHLDEEPHLVLEAEDTAGGLCRSREIDGFVFDTRDDALRSEIEALGLASEALDTMMLTAEISEQVARATLAVANRLR